MSWGQDNIKDLIDKLDEIDTRLIDCGTGDTDSIIEKQVMPVLERIAHALERIATQIEERA